MLPGIISAFAWFTIFVVLKWGYFHRHDVIDRGKFSTRMFLTCVGGNVISTGLIVASTGMNTSILHAELCGLFTMAFLFVVYTPFYYTIATSLSVQTLVLLARNGGEISVQKLIQQFTSEEFVKARLMTMMRNGYVFRKGDTFYPSSKGLVLSRVFSLIKKIWRLGAGG